MKLIVQIPCFNEESTLPHTIAEIPRSIGAIDRVEILVIDDGSTDRTVEVARALGVDHIISHRSNRGLARAFRTGLDACLSLGADIIVNTDGDNQYPGEQIPKLIAPILAGEADIVVGDRATASLQHFSWTKRALQRVGSAVVRSLSDTDVGDVVCGFRALSREAAYRLNIVSPFSYTIEMLIQAGRKRLAVKTVNVGARGPTRPSRLARNMFEFVGRSLATMVRMYTMYRPLQVFFTIGLTIAMIGAIPIVRFLYYYFSGEGEGKIQSLVLGGVLVTIGMFTLLIGVVADLISLNRELLEISLERSRRTSFTRTGAEDLRP